MKTNKNNAKLLAAVMAFAMVFVAAFAIVGVSDDSDADVGASTAISGYSGTAGDEIAGTITLPVDESRCHKVTEDSVVTIPGSSSAESITITLFVKATKTVTVVGTAGAGSATKNVTVVVMAADATATNYLNSDSTVTITGMTDGRIVVKNSVYGVAGTTYSTMDVSGTITTAVSVAGVAGSGVQTASNGNLIAASATQVTHVKYGVSFTDADTRTVKYWPAGSDVSSITLTAPAADNVDAVTVAIGKAIVSQGQNMVTIDNTANTDYTKAITITAVNGTDAKPTIEGELNVATSTLTINSGIFTKGDSVLSGNGSYNLVRIQNSTSPYDIAYTNQIVEYTDATKYIINGTVTQTQTVNPTPGLPIELSDGSTLVIREGVTLKVTTITGTSETDHTEEVRVFGQLNSSTVTDATILVGPNGYSATAATKNTNVVSGKDTEIAGDVTSSTLGNCVVATGGLTIPEGKTVTLEGNLGLNGGVLTVNGKLIIAKGSAVFGTGVAAEEIIIGEKGSIENQGDFAKINAITVVDVTPSTPKSITVQGVSGVQFVYAKIGNDATCFSVTGDVKALKNLPTGVTSMITISDGAAISGEFTVGKDVTVINGNSGGHVNILKGSVVTVNGTLTTNTGGDGYKVGEGAELIINGAVGDAGMNVPIIISTGKYAESDNEYDEEDTNIVTFNVTDAGSSSYGSYSGITFYNQRVANPNSETSEAFPFIRNAYINGVIKDGLKETGTDLTPTVTLASGTVTVADELVIKDDARFTNTGSGFIIVEGKITVMDESAVLANYKGAHYTVTPSVEADVIGYYTTVAAAMDAIDTADEKTVTINVDTLKNNVTVKAEQTVSITATGLDKDAVFTAEDNSTVSGSISGISGMVVIAGDAVSGLTVSGYASEKTGTDGTKTYAGFSVAVGNAVPGDVITIGTATVGESERESLAIPAGVKVVVTGMLTINGNLTIPATAELVGGTVIVNGTTSKAATVDVAGKLDLSEGALAGNYNTVTSTGEVIVQGIGSNMNGAYYDDDGKKVLTTVANAVAKSDAVTVVGKYTDMSDITLDKANLTIAEGAEVVLGNITLVDKKIIATGDLTATITAKCGSDETTGAVSDAVLKLVKSAITVESKSTTSAAGVTSYALLINGIDGEMTVSAGTVTTNAVIETIDNDSKFAVASGAEFAVVNDVTINGANVAFVVDGTVSVKSATITFANCDADKAAVINGTLDVKNAGTVDAYDLSILGTVNVVNTDTETGNFTVKSNDVTVGAPVKSLGAGAAVTGPISISGQYLIVYAGADMSGALIDVSAGVSAAKSTEFYVNDMLYATVYNNGNTDTIWNGGSAEAGYKVITPAMLNKIVGVNKFEYADGKNLVWTDAEGNKIDNKKVGDVPALYTKMTVSSADLTISVGQGISLYIDGVRYDGSVKSYAVGEHTVQAIVDPGYKGETAITFNGASVTNGKIVVTADMVGAADKPVLSVTGDIAIDNGSSSGSSSNDDGMGITDILLIVLVVLAAILVVVVAIRMMRS